MRHRQVRFQGQPIDRRRDANFVVNGRSDLTPFTIDRTAEFCQAVHMSRSIRKFVAVFIAIWLPLFSGNVLAVSVGMQSMSGDSMGRDCHAAAVHQDAHHVHHASAEQYSGAAADHGQSSCFYDHQDSGCGNSGICHLACSGYLATASVTLVGARPSAQLVQSSSTQFQSAPLTPFDPPPLARA